MQSDGNNSCEDVVSDSFNKTPRDEDSNLDRIYQSKYVRIIIVHDDLSFFFKSYENVETLQEH